MKRLLILLALAGLGTAIGCGDDQPEKTTVKDAGPIDAGNQGRGQQIDNVGAACDTNASCMGPGASCQKEFGMDQMTIKLEGGYCTAACTAAAECSAGGGCPAAEIGASLGQFGGLISGIIPSYCLDKCDPNIPTDCRTGYTCTTFAKIASGIEGIGALAAGVLGATGQVPYCLPPITLPTLPGRDGGVRTTTTITGIDGGVVDAGR